MAAAGRSARATSSIRCWNVSRTKPAWRASRSNIGSRRKTLIPRRPDDCEAAALWVVREGTKRFGTTKLSIGGELAGGHLSAVTLLRLRDRHKMTPFPAALMNYGCYDLGMTPSARQLGR